MTKAKQLFISFMLITLLPGCNDESLESDNNMNVNEPVNSSDYFYYVSGKINGESFFYGQRLDATTLDYQQVFSIPLEAATCAYSFDQGLDYKINYGTSVYPNFDNEGTQPALGFDFVRFYRCSDSQSSTEVFNDLFSVGNYEFSEDNANSGTMKQLGINYSPIAASGDYYESYGGVQTNSMFTITETLEDNDYLLEALINVRQIVEGEFSVKLYNVNDSSDVIEITDGQFKISLTK